MRHGPGSQPMGDKAAGILLRTQNDPMTLQQSLAVGIVAAMMVLFIWGRFRYDLVAALALLAAVAAGVVPAKEAFSGFADDIVIIVASALLVSAAVARSGVTEAVMRRIAPYA